MKLSVKAKRILSLCLAAVMVLSMLPAAGLLGVKAAATTKSVVLFDDDYADSVTGHHASLTVVDDPNAVGNKVLQVGDNYARLWMQNAAGISLTAAKANSGKLVLEFYAQSAGNTLDLYVLNDVNNTYDGQAFLDYTVVAGWNTLEIPVTDITADTIYGVSVYSGIWTKTEEGVCHYVDNVRIEWEEEEAAPSRGQVVLFDDAFTGNVTGNHASLTVVDDPNTSGNKVLQVGDNYARLWMQNTAGISLTEAKANSGKLVLEFYAQSAGNTLDLYVLNDVNNSYDGQEFLDYTVAAGWNTLEIPVTDITADTIYGVSVYSGIWTKTEDGVYHYLDNVRIEWGHKAIEIATQPASMEVSAYETAELVVGAGLSDGSDASGLQYQWYQCDDADKTGAVAIEGATAASYLVHIVTAGTSYYYCTVSAEGLESVDSDVATVTVKPNKTQVLFDDAFADSIKAADQAGISIIENILGADGNTSSVISLTNTGWDLSRFGTGEYPMDITSVVAGAGNLELDIYATWATTDAQIRIYTGAWQSTNKSFTIKLNTGWNTVSIPVSEVGSTDFYGIGILSHAGTCYLDNIRFAWCEEPAAEKITNASITLDAALGVNFVAPSGYKMTVTVGGESYDVTEDNGVYSVSVFAQDMTKDIVATLTDSMGNTLDTKTFTLAGYVADIHAGNHSQQIKDLAAATLNYCQYAAKVKGNYDGACGQLAQITQGAFDGYAFSGGKAPAGTSIHCYLEEACELRLRMATNAYTVCVDGVETGPQELNGTYVYSVGEMLAQDYDKAYTFTVTDGEGTEVFSGSYSVMGYLGKCLERGLGGEDMQNLLKAMYHYHIAAAAYEAANTAG